MALRAGSIRRTKGVFDMVAIKSACQNGGMRVFGPGAHFGQIWATRGIYATNGVVEVHYNILLCILYTRNHVLIHDVRMR